MNSRWFHVFGNTREIGQELRECFHIIRLIVRKDLLAEMRTRSSFPPNGSLCNLIAGDHQYYPANRSRRPEIVPGILWIILIFCGSWD